MRAPCGIPVRLVRSGNGLVLARWRIQETQFLLGLSPFDGVVITYPFFDVHRGKWALVLLGGILGNIALLIVLSRFEGRHGSGPFLGGIALAQYLIILLTAFPHPKWGAEGTPRTDIAF